MLDDSTRHIEVEVRRRRLRLADIVPLARELTEIACADGIAHAQRQGKTVTCGKGCSDCCSAFLVFPSLAEMFYIYDEIQALPPGKREHVYREFERAREVLAKAGPIEIPEDIAGDEAARSRIGLASISEFIDAADLTCPLLESSACSLYSMRPVLCREFMATTPAELCRPKLSDQQELVKLPFYVFNALCAWEVAMEERTSRQPVIMLAMLNWCPTQQSRTQKTWHGMEMVEAFLVSLASRVLERESTDAEQ